VLTFRILTRADGCVFCCEPGCAGIPTPTPELDGLGRRVFDTNSGELVIVVEAAPGLSGLPVSTSLIPGANGRPDLQIQNTRGMGNGSLTVCDTGPASSGGGGVPGIPSPSFTLGDPFITNALNDFACRFQAFQPGAPCTLLDASRDPKLINSSATAQFCDFVSPTAALPSGQSLLTVAVRDQSGQLGPTAQVVVRVASPTPTPN
jgi:hypothetical protein